jgi:hypothetical protein
MSLDAWKFLGVDASSSIKNRSQEGAGQGKKNTCRDFFPTRNSCTLLAFALWPVSEPGCIHLAELDLCVA